jgi:ribosomal protein S7
MCGTYLSADVEALGIDGAALERAAADDADVFAHDLAEAAPRATCTAVSDGRTETHVHVHVGLRRRERT